VRWLTALAALLIFFGAPRAVAAQSIGSGDDVLVRVGGPLVVAKDQSVDTAVGVGGPVRIDGVVRDNLYVIGGAATVNGAVDGDVQVVNGTLELGPAAKVGNVVLTNSTMPQNDATRVTGPVERSNGFDFRGIGRVFSFLWWIGSTIFLVLVALAAMALAPNAVRRAGHVLTEDFGGAIVSALIYWIGLPIVAVIILFTVIGIPIGLGILLVLLPISWVAGFVVAATRLGDEIMSQVGSVGALPRGLAAAVVGVLAIQIIGLIPVIGGIIVSLSGLLGAGAIVRTLWLGRQPRPPLPAGPTTTAGPVAAP
jgi:hypothetical protein